MRVISKDAVWMQKATEVDDEDSEEKEGTNNLGKWFEARFLENWRATVKNSCIDRLKDTSNNFIKRDAEWKCKEFVVNPSDFIGTTEKYTWYLECKSICGNTWSDPRQLERLWPRDSIPGVKTLYVLWWRDFGKIIGFSASTYKKILEDGNCSINYKKHVLNDKYDFIIFPINFDRGLINADYSVLNTW